MFAPERRGKWILQKPVSIFKKSMASRYSYLDLEISTFVQIFEFYLSGLIPFKCPMQVTVP
jgi:hypothetical protein